MIPDAGAQPPWTMRLLVVIARFSPDLEVTPELLAEGAPGLLEIPTVLGAVVLAYNVPGVTTGLKLTPAVISGIG